MRVGSGLTAWIYLTALLFLISLQLVTSLHITRDNSYENEVTERSSDHFYVDGNTFYTGEEQPHQGTQFEHHNIKRRWSTYSKLLNLFMKRRKPWLFLRNSGYCYQQQCKSNKECCRKNNICDQSAHVCIDCWYGYPCRKHADCCERYPVCSKKNRRCSRE